MKEIYMKLGIVVVVFSILIGSYLNPKKEEVPKEEALTTKQEEVTPPPTKEAVMVSVAMDSGTQEVELETYLIGVVSGEMPATFEMEALKAQAVASRTFVYKRGLQVDNTTNTQVYLTEEQMRNNWGDEYESKRKKVEEAITQTSGEVMLYNGDFISALFFSSTNGKTENCHDYFAGEPVPYLQSVESPWDQTINPNNVRTKSFTKEELQSAFGIGDVSLQIVSHKESGRVEQVTINDRQYTGREVREKLGLASSDFTISYADGQYVFTTVGSGHGVGMSQYGAQGMALEGKSYQDILHHYYTNVTIEKK